MKKIAEQSSGAPALFKIERIESCTESSYCQRNELLAEDHYKIVWFSKGSGILNEYVHFDASRHNYVFFLNKSLNNKIYLNTGCQGYIITFNDEFLNIGELEVGLTCHLNLFLLRSKSRGIVIDNEMLDSINEIITKMIVEYANCYLFKTEILNRYFKIFLIYLSRQLDGVMSPVAHTRKTELVHSFNEAIEKHFRKKKMVADYADILFISSNYLNMIIKEETGHSAGYHIRQRIALEAKKMALYSANNMKEIAYHLGFPDSTHFSKFFKATTGNNFTVYKKEKLSLTIKE